MNTEIVISNYKKMIEIDLNLC